MGAAGMFPNSVPKYFRSGWNSVTMVAVGAQPDVQLLESVIVDEIELNVLVAAAFARRRIRGAQQIEFGASFRRGLLLCLRHVCLFRRRGCLWEKK